MAWGWIGDEVKARAQGLRRMRGTEERAAHDCMRVCAFTCWCVSLCACVCVCVRSEVWVPERTVVA